MRYKNLKTGAIIDVKSEIDGKEWEPLGAPVQIRETDKTEKAEEAPEPKTEDVPASVPVAKKTTRKKSKKNE